ncbi:ENTH/VHS domain-containing protein [Schizosaccharomyces octosporus yFS286]|uniref:ENTH/VHS domain-containing protein n=1 Tax=Schizosaccharomyces octosporus (strain yFS286) TaxID=483514 RepID=S9Q3I5_SCHOY|nr:ENTH/VHS domain-containing protein [Schizosaccharomyces octosporus yFS286]EPX74617.1 ENTH/VHS domain-containing protein [Schizosaccharomyces octosporus yFS286]
MSIHTSSLQNDERDTNISSPIEEKYSFSASHLPFHQLQRASVRYHNGDYSSNPPFSPKHQRLHVNLDPSNSHEPLAAARASVSSSSEHLQIINRRKNQFGVSASDRYSKNHNSFLESSSRKSGFVSNAAAIAASRLSSSQSLTTRTSSKRTPTKAFPLTWRQHEKKTITSRSGVKDPLVNAKVLSNSVSSTDQKIDETKSQQKPIGYTANSHSFLNTQDTTVKNKHHIRKTTMSSVSKSLDHTSGASKSAYKYPKLNLEFGKNAELFGDNTNSNEARNVLHQSNNDIESKEGNPFLNSSFVRKAAKISSTISRSESNDDMNKSKDERSLLNANIFQRSMHRNLNEKILPSKAVNSETQASNDRSSNNLNTLSIRPSVRNAAVIASNTFQGSKDSTGHISQYSTLPPKELISKTKDIEVSKSMPFTASVGTFLSSPMKRIQPQNHSSIPNTLPLAAARKIAMSAKHSLQRLKDSHFNRSNSLFFAFHAASQVSGVNVETAYNKSTSHYNFNSSAHIAANQAVNEKKDIPLRLSLSSDPTTTVPITTQNKDVAALFDTSIPNRSPHGHSSPLSNRLISTSEDVFYDAADDENALDPFPTALEALCDSSHNTEESSKTLAVGEIDRLGNYTDTESSEERPSNLTEKAISTFKNSLLNFSNDTAKALKWRLSGVLQPEKVVAPSLFYLHREALDSSSAVHAAAIADRSFPVIQEKPPPLKTKALKKPSPHTLRRPSRKKRFFSKRSNGRFRNAKVSKISKNIDIPRFVIDENRRKVYEGLWAANKGYLLRGTDVAYPENYICDIVVRELWSRCGAPTSVLAYIYSLVDRSHIHMLNREEFIVGMFLIDQYLTGRKLPLKVPDSVWISSKRMGEMLWRLEQLQKKTRTKKNRFKRKVYKGLKWEIGSDHEEKGEEGTAT